MASFGDSHYSPMPIKLTTTLDPNFKGDYFMDELRENLLKMQIHEEVVFHKSSHMSKFYTLMNCFRNSPTRPVYKKACSATSPIKIFDSIIDTYTSNLESLQTYANLEQALSW